MPIPKVMAGVVFNVALYALLLFIPAGTLHWWRAWVFLAVTVAVMLVAILSVLPDNADLFSQRAKGIIQKGQPLGPSSRNSAGCLVCGPDRLYSLDVFRFHLVSKPGEFVSFLGLALYVAGWWIVILAMKVNPFAVPVVRLQEERHQRVIDTGVYAVVRHPMYTGFVPMVVGSALWLQSYVAALLAIVPIAVLAVRSVFEERFLKRELRGYEAYTRKVRYRLIPCVW